MLALNLKNLSKIALFGTAFALMSGAALAAQTLNQESVGFAISAAEAQRAVSYWTPERMRAAVPLEWPAMGVPQDGSGAAGNGVPFSHSSFKPTVEPIPAPSEVITQVPGNQSGSEATAPSPSAKGPDANAYTTSLVFPPNQVQRFPYRVVGKLFFTDPRAPSENNSGVCTASIIAKRLIITAAHCLYDTKSNYWHTNFVFVPAYDGSGSFSIQPFHTWGASQARVPSQWRQGCCVPSAYDFGAVELYDQEIDEQPFSIGDYLGYLGFVTSGLIGNNVTQLGYPHNLSFGEKMIQNNSQVSPVVAGFHPVFVLGKIGTAMEEGSSGGPWIQNFGETPPGQVINARTVNRIVGVTSYGRTKPGGQYAVASVLNSAFTALYKQLCGRQPGNC